MKPKLKLQGPSLAWSAIEVLYFKSVLIMGFLILNGNLHIMLSCRMPQSLGLETVQITDLKDPNLVT